MAAHLSPLKRLVLPLILNLGLMGYLIVFHSDAWWWQPDSAIGADLLTKITQLLQFIVLAYFINKLIWVLHDRAEEQAATKVVPKLAIHIIVVLIYVVMALAGLNLVFNQPLETFLAASGVLGFVVGLALRGLVSDLFCGIALALDSSIQSGDWLMFQHRGREIKAQFIEFNWRLTHLVDGDGIGILIPNSEFSAVTVVNLTRPTTVAWHSASLQLDITVDQGRVLTILQNAADKAVSEGFVNASPGPTARVSGISNGLITFTTAFTLAPEKFNRTAIHHLLNNSLKFLNVAGISVVSVSHMSQVIQEDHDASAESVAQLEARARSRAVSLLPFFFFLSQEELDLIGQTTASRKIAKNAPIFNNGDAGDSMFVVLEGGFQVVIQIDDKPQVVAHLWPGDFFGEMSLFTGAPRSATIVARDHSVVLEIGKDTVAGLFQRNLSFAETVAGVIDARLAANAAKIDASKNANQAPAAAPKSILGAIKSFFKL
jgi:small-conductance mechanosensitive channel/CRP-like cAMP-binding protein